MKIDISKIDGYKDMSDEDKRKALESFEFDEPDYSGYVKKDLYDKKVSELATKKKELESKMSEDELIRQQREEEFESMKNELATLRMEKTIGNYATKLAGLGYDEKSATETAKLLANGNMDKVFESLSKFKTAIEKNVKAEVLKSTPRPEGGEGDSVMDLKKFKAMSWDERAQFAQDHPEEYSEITKGD